MLTDKQRAWADAQVGQPRTTGVSGVVTKVSGRQGEYVLTVEGDDGAATFEAHLPAEVARAHKGVESQVLVEGTVADVEYDEASGRVGFIVQGDNGRATDWQLVGTPDPVEPVSREEANEAVRAFEQQKTADLRSRVLALVREDAAFRADLAAALLPDTSA